MTTTTLRIVAAALAATATVALASGRGEREDDEEHEHEGRGRRGDGGGREGPRGREAQARRERPSFSGFSAAEGKKLYTSEHVQDGQPVSCATCHTANPRAQGRSPVGKIVDPLSPAVNPVRFSDPAETEKWFKRDCKQVLGRECTAEEKGHFTTFVLGA